MIKGNIHRQVIENSLKENSLTENDPRTAIIINNIDVKLVRLDQQPITQSFFMGKSINDKDPTFSIEKEVVEIKLYRDMNGLYKRIGMTKAVQDILGLPLEIIEDMNRQILSLDLQVNGLQIAVNNQIAIIKKYETMCFWERLKYLLKGVAKCK